MSVRSQLNITYELLMASLVQAKAIREQILPSAKKAFAGASAGFRMGKFPYLEMLDAQRTLYEVQSQYIDSLEAYNLARASLERLIGQDLKPAASGRPASEGAKNAQ